MPFCKNFTLEEIFSNGVAHRPVDAAMKTAIMPASLAFEYDHLEAENLDFTSSYTSSQFFMWLFLECLINDK